MRNSYRIWGFVTLGLLLAQFVIILLSWLVTAAMPEEPLRSLLSSEGVRWYFGHMIENFSSPYLSWLLLLCVALGAVKSSRIFSIKFPLTFRQRLALQLVGVELLIFLAIIASLTLLPHAILLSVTGHLYPSSFSQGIIPIGAFALIAFSISYAVVCGEVQKIEDAFSMLTAGIITAAPLFVVYLLAVQLYASAVFMLTVN
ncbi:hypothetical protein HMPREF3034_02473 [Prevotella sp. DNF00663]|uniref:AbgT family transporter n=1 Tax=unclassified Prevotella TaxID=2638335 RepID=UPI000512B831|nr:MULTISPECIES: AbgT family transporter [unclassified Prevotella]KGI61086.1 hypothetical protein HMPREF0671_02275 [Prevotella sp. S7 MS 2]KXB78331.1 hypothetical protein HMPREF3034_02473 [Prevotella sp. DNF00663]